MQSFASANHKIETRLENTERVIFVLLPKITKDNWYEDQFQP